MSLLTLPAATDRRPRTVTVPIHLADAHAPQPIPPLDDDDDDDDDLSKPGSGGGSIDPDDDEGVDDDEDDDEEDTLWTESLRVL